MAGHAELRVLLGGREAIAWCEERERFGVVYIGARDLPRRKQSEHHHNPDTQKISEMCMKIRGQWSRGWCGHTMGAPASLGPPPSSGFCLGACACMVILEMLVSDFCSVRSASDSQRCP